MTLLDTGIALVVFGTPILALLLTLVVSLIESFYLNFFIKSFWKTFKSSLLVNAISTVVGFVAIIWLNVADGFGFINRITGLTFKISDGIRGYVGRLLLLVLFYILTLFIELPLFRMFLSSGNFNLQKKVIIANLISYALIAIVFFLLH